MVSQQMGFRALITVGICLACSSSLPRNPYDVFYFNNYIPQKERIPIRRFLFGIIPGYLKAQERSEKLHQQNILEKAIRSDYRRKVLISKIHKPNGNVRLLG